MRISFIGFCTLSLCKRKFDCDHRAAAGLGMQSAFAAQMRDSLFDTEQTQAFRVLHIKTLAIVLYGKRQPAWLLQHFDPYGGGVRMAGTVMQRFLDNAVDAGFVLVRKVV